MYSISFQEDSLLPRERLVAEGAEQLSNQELLSILLRTGNKKETVFQVSQRILSTISSLNELRNMTLQELQSISGNYCFAAASFTRLTHSYYSFESK